jgi:hypothetical protein
MDNGKYKEKAQKTHLVREFKTRDPMRFWQINKESEMVSL